jgi:RNA polymerase sigma factor (sigma-70 family)
MRSSIDTYFFTVLSHHLGNWHKARAGAARAIALPDGFAESWPAGATEEDAIDRAESGALTARVLRVLHQSIDRFPRDDRLLLLVRYQCGCALRQLAEEFRISSKAASHRIYRLVHTLPATLVRAGITRADVTQALQCLGRRGLPSAFRDSPCAAGGVCAFIPRADCPALRLPA